MRTNFNHLKPYPKYFESGVSVEKQIINAQNQAELKMAGNAMRQLVEGLLEELLAKHGLVAKDFHDSIKQVKEQRIMHRASVNHLYRIKKLGNISSHPKDTISKEQLHEMYGLVYEETYRLVKYYLTDKAVNDYKKAKQEGQLYQKNPKQSYHSQKQNFNNENAENKNSSWLAIGIGIVVAIVCLCLVL